MQCLLSYYTGQEGSSRKSQKDQAHFTQISFTSLMEVLNLMILSNDLEFIEEDQYLEIRPLIEEISNKLNALHKSQSNKK